MNGGLIMFARKKINVIFLAISFAFSIAAAETENLILNPTGENNFKGYWKSPNAKVISSDGTTVFSGFPESAVKSENYAKITQVIERSAEELQDKNFELSFEICPVKIGGSFRVAVREAYGKYATYHGRTFKHLDEDSKWQRVTIPFKTHKDTTQLVLYLDISYPNLDDRIEIKNLQFIEK